MREGSQTTGDITQTSTGFLKLASGTTAQRPVAPTNGMFRHNTTTGAIEHYSGNQWNALGFFGSSSTLHIAQPISSNGLPSSDLLFVKDLATGKALSVDSVLWDFAIGGATNLAWLQIDSSITGADVGYTMPYNGTVFALMGYSVDRSTKVKNISIYVDDVEYTNQMSFTNTVASGGLMVSDNLDFNAGSKIRLRVRSPESGPLGGIAVTVFTKWRL